MSLFHDDDYSGNNHFGDGHNPHRTPYTYRDHPPSCQSRRAEQRHSASPARKVAPRDDSKVAHRYNNASRKKEGGEIIDLLIALLRVKHRFNRKDPPSP